VKLSKAQKKAISDLRNGASWDTINTNTRYALLNKGAVVIGNAIGDQYWEAKSIGYRSSKTGEYLAQFRELKDYEGNVLNPFPFPSI
jgi:hypothetical protein